MQKYTGDWPNWIALTGEIIAQNAKECAWPYGTSKSKYTYEKGDIKKNPNPKQYGNYKKQLDIILKTLTMINSNVNIELLLDYFVIEMRRSLKN